MRTNYYGAYYTLHDGKFTHKEQAAAPSILARLDMPGVGWSDRTDSGRNYVDSLRCDAQTIA